MRDSPPFLSLWMLFDYRFKNFIKNENVVFEDQILGVFAGRKASKKGKTFSL